MPETKKMREYKKLPSECSHNQSVDITEKRFHNGMVETLSAKCSECGVDLPKALEALRSREIANNQIIKDMLDMPK